MLTLGGADVNETVLRIVSVIRNYTFVFFGEALKSMGVLRIIFGALQCHRERDKRGRGVL